MRAAGVSVEVGLGAPQALRDHAGHIRRMRDGRPHVILKLAVSADGKVGLAGRKPVALTGEAARERVHMMRATSDAILIGVGTALADDPLLTCRLPGMAARSPVRVVLDSALRLPLGGKLAMDAEEAPVWVLAEAAALQENERDLAAEGVIVQRIASSEPGRLDLEAVLKALAARGITRLMVEGGPTVAAAFVSADLVDEAVIFRSQQTIGPDGIDALEGLPLSALTESRSLRPRGVELVGADTMEEFERRT
jgi:diaminohydroxyphosphoribosylaminopyrimidine deaminase/5-amino-6-(5-phosphoribosylamino)uracil reductase